MWDTYSHCYNLTGSPVCGENVTNMLSTYEECTNLTGSPVCGDKVISMARTYSGCSNLTGSPVCGNSVTSMYHTYYNCSNLTGSPVCGNSVYSLGEAYFNCTNLTGSPVCGLGVDTMDHAYWNCYNLFGNSYLYSLHVSNMRACFYGRNISNRLNLYVPANSTTLNTCLYNDYHSMIGTSITWTDDIITNSYYYNTQYNIYIYPVENVAAARAANGD
jgi:hypothetical protein